MAQGKEERDLDFFFAMSDDAWERSAKVVWMVHNLYAAVAGLFGTKIQCKKPDDFNDSLLGPDDVPGSDPDDYPWAEPEDSSREGTA